MSKALNEYLLVKREVIKEKRSAGGIILNVSSAFDFRDQFSERNICFAEVVGANENISFLHESDRIAMNPNKGMKVKIEFDELNLITKEQVIAKVNSDNSFTVTPDNIMLKINKKDTDSLYSKWITRNDGSKVQLFIQPELHRDSDNRAKIFVSFGEVVQVGENVKGVEVGDIGILDYTVDNELDNILFYDEEKNKHIVIEATTTFHDCDEWAYGSRLNVRDVKVSAKGDMNVVSPLLALIRNGKLIAREPYVFINHEKNIVDKQTDSGIFYTDTQFVMKRNVLAVSEKSTQKFGMYEGQSVIVEDFDIFDIKLPDASFIQCIIDKDILMGVK